MDDKRKLDERIDNLQKSTSERVAEKGGDRPVLRATDEGPTPSIGEEMREPDMRSDDKSRHLRDVTQEEANMATGKGWVKNRDDMGS